MAKRSASVADSDMNELLSSLSARFSANMNRHKGLKWADVEKRLVGKPTLLRSLHLMESTGGEPDVIGMDGKSGAYIFCDRAAETPAGRRSLCYDEEALLARKEHKPAGSALGMAAEMGIELLTEADYRALQELGEFDRKTSSWLLTPEPIRTLGGALFGDRRYGQVFIYHNGVQSYYGGRGFRGKLLV
jgi:hypothetical protein